jgi:collagenase-like PrtC family protease
VSLHHDFAGLDTGREAKLVESLRGEGIEPDVMVTESCSRCCPVREQHYAFFGENARMEWTPAFTDPFQIGCVIDRLQRPETLLDLAGFLSPSRLDAFSDLTGITGFKLSGRSMPSEWVLNCLKHYAARRDPANIFELVVFTTPFLEEMKMASHDLFFLSADAYRELFDELVETRVAVSERRGWIQDKAAQFFNEGRLRINDPGSEYSVHGGVLRCVKPGEYALMLRSAMRSSGRIGISSSGAAGI